MAAAGVLQADAKKPIDNQHQQRQYALVGVNPPASFDRLTPNGKQAAMNSFQSGIFTFAHTPHCLSSMVAGGGRRSRLLVSLGQSVNLLPCCRPNTFDSVLVALKHLTKGNTMSTIRKGYSRPLITHHIRTFPTLIQASAFVDRLTVSNTAAYRFNIQQTAADKWTVARVASGGVA